jgi:hypothetical protein
VAVGSSEMGLINASAMAERRRATSYETALTGGAEPTLSILVLVAMAALQVLVTRWPSMLGCLPPSTSPSSSTLRRWAT